jgi:hypothetical protein
MSNTFGRSELVGAARVQAVAVASAAATASIRRTAEYRVKEGTPYTSERRSPRSRMGQLRSSLRLAMASAIRAG